MYVIYDSKTGEIVHTHTEVDAHGNHLEIPLESLYTVLNPSIDRSTIAVARIKTPIEQPASQGKFFIDPESRKLAFREDQGRPGAGTIAPSEKMKEHRH